MRTIIDQVIDGTDAYLVQLVLRGRSGSRVVDVYVDSDDGLGVDRLAEMSREIGFLLEAEDVIRGRYRLNVSSPGADRPLRLLRQYHKHVGRPLRVDLGEGEAAEGVLRAVGEQDVTLESKSGEAVTVPFERIREAVVQLPW